jgi:hypothetical protein
VELQLMEPIGQGLRAMAHWKIQFAFDAKGYCEGLSTRPWSILRRKDEILMFPVRQAMAKNQVHLILLAHG